MTDEVPFQPLPARMAGLPVDKTLHDGVPEWLSDPLRDWLAEALEGDEALSQHVAMRLRWARGTPGSRYSNQLIWCRADQLLTVIDAVLQLNTGLWLQSPDIVATHPATRLRRLLADGASRYTVDLDRRCITVLIDPTITAATEQAIAADPTAGDHLRTAFAAAYGLDPDPDKAYDHAVLAVEALTCPLVCPNNPRRTLGRVIADLRSQDAQWALMIGDSSGRPAGPGRLVEMLALLWEGQSRHAGAPNSRRQGQVEAEAAVHLAATLVQWISSGVLYRL